MNARQHLASRYVDRHPEAAARALRGLAPEAVAGFVVAATPEQQDALLGAMAPEEASACVRALPVPIRSTVVDRMPVERAAPMLRLLSSDDREPLLSSLSPPRRRRLERAVRYGPRSAGGIAEVDVPTALGDHSVDQATKRSHKRGPDLPYVYVIDHSQRLVGVVSRRELGRARSDTRLEDLMTRTVHRIQAFTPLRELRAHPAWHDLDVLPVVDGAGVLVGIIRHKTLRRIGTESVAAAPAEAGGTVAVGLAYCELLARGLVALTTVPVTPDPASASEEGVTA